VYELDVGRPSPVGRRAFLGWAASAAAAWATTARAAGPVTGAEPLPTLRVPPFTRNGAKVPIVVEMDHPMSPEHHVRAVHVANPHDPVPSKGTFELTPANGRVYVAFQARMHDGASEVVATADCSRRGPLTARSAIRIPADGGG